KYKTDKELADILAVFRDPLLRCVNSEEEGLNNGKTTWVEEFCVLPNGEIKTFDVIKGPLFDEEGRRKGLVTIGRDISELKAAEDIDLRREKLAVVGALAAGIDHGSRSPLTPIKGFIQLQKGSNKSNEDISDIF